MLPFVFFEVSIRVVLLMRMHDCMMPLLLQFIFGIQLCLWGFVVNPASEDNADHALLRPFFIIYFPLNMDKNIVILIRIILFKDLYTTQYYLHGIRINILHITLQPPTLRDI